MAPPVVPPPNVREILALGCGSVIVIVVAVFADIADLQIADSRYDCFLVTAIACCSHLLFSRGRAASPQFVLRARASELRIGIPTESYSEYRKRCVRAAWEGSARKLGVHGRARTSENVVWIGVRARARTV